MWLILLLYAFFGSSFPISKVLLRYTNPIFLTGIRMTIAGALLLGYQYFYSRKHFRFKMEHFKYFAQYAILGVYLTYILRFWALYSMPAAKTSFFFNLTPFFSAFYSYYMFNERLTKQQWLGLTIGFLGFIPILLSSSGSEKLIGEFAFISWAEIALFVAVACSSYSWMVMRKLVRIKNYAPATVNGTCMLFGGLLALPTAYFFEPWQPVVDPGAFISWLALIIIVSNIICHNLYAYLLHHYSATFLAFSGFLGPLFAALYGWIFLNERVGWHFYTSAVFVFIGLYLFYQHELQTEPIVKEEH